MLNRQDYIQKIKSFQKIIVKLFIGKQYILTSKEKFTQKKL